LTWAPAMNQVHRHWLFAAVLVGVFLVPFTTRAQVSSPPAEEPPTSQESQDKTPNAQDQSTLPAPPVAPPVTALPSAAPAPAPVDKPAGLNFEFFGSEGAVAPNDAKDSEISLLSKKRRHRLELHQLLGLTTWAFMGASCVIGQLNYNDLYGGGSGRGSYMMPHRILVYSTTILFGVTAAYALFAPQPYKKPLKFDTGLLHRIAAIGATAGILTEVVLGFITARTADSGNPDGLKRMATIHDVVGWTTFGFMTAAGTAWLF
ncbi:MAG TPA: hypothetical protein VIM14_03995, partial [Polyangia bacterium]